MDIMQAMKERHSVRSYTDQAITGTVKEELESFVSECNAESGMHMQLILNEPNAFTGGMAHYGNFQNVKNYIALVGPKESDLDEKAGWFGEKVVLKAQGLGLNTCWVAMTFNKSKTVCDILPGEKLALIISIGYGTTQGVPHKSKPASAVMKSETLVPEWFQKGIEAALLAPTALNQQKFSFIRQGDTNKVSAKAGIGFYTKIDLGIAKYHFELGAGKENFVWAER